MLKFSSMLVNISRRYTTEQLGAFSSGIVNECVFAVVCVFW